MSSRPPPPTGESNRPRQALPVAAAVPSGGSDLVGTSSGHEPPEAAPAVTWTRLPSLLLVPLFLAGWAALERCGAANKSIAPAAADSSNAPMPLPVDGARSGATGASAQLCPADTLPDGQLCVPVPRAEPERQAPLPSRR